MTSFQSFNYLIVMDLNRSWFRRFRPFSPLKHYTSLNNKNANFNFNLGYDKTLKIMKGLHAPIERYGNAIGNRFIPCLIIILTLTFPVYQACAQQAEDYEQRQNTIKLDLTGTLYYRTSAVFSYERVTKPNQSFAISAGYQEFPKLTSLGENIKSTKDLNRRGFKGGVEYRFYLSKENKYKAPHGVYIGPYAAYLNFNNERNIESISESGEVKSGFLKTELSVINIGVQLGYQFVLNNRWTVDLVFIGPSVSRYGAKLTVDGNYNIDEEELLQNEIIQKLITKFPLLEDLIQDKTVEGNGKLNSWSYGYRYQFLIGYHFGRKKK